MQFTDPIYKTIQIEDNDIIDLIQSKAFQRLSSIKQQGNTFFLQEKAVHTRFQHSLGVYELSKQVLSKLMKSNEITLSSYELKVATVSALLHDIGHGPFSHCFQSISGHDHGDLSIRIIEESEDITNILMRTPNLLEDVSHVLKGDGAYKMIEEILFGALSLDQLDFWNRDLYYSRIQIRPFDINRLTDSLRFKEDKLMINVDGVPEIECMISMKKTLYKNGFGHPFVVGKDLILKEIYKRVIKEDIELESKPLLNILREDILDINDYLSIYDETLVNEITKICTMEENKELANLAMLYLSPKRSLKYEESFSDIACEIGVVIEENKNYSSYTGGIFVLNEKQSFDIKHQSEHIQTMMEMSSIRRVYFLNESIST
ncbi:HD domain-containing protein [Chengkuizengella sediminis]|uniref:HD domain-containing protein n=1 Tax=Chengkuizengella sediminis TaxID=1885917 RepID=UPI00138A4AB0|nr:HD domain-containing protein [Chengkuizengella sediminis]NDI35485.1 HD domain-containing protein [Chengkuizengella sediminis]